MSLIMDKLAERGLNPDFLWSGVDELKCQAWFRLTTVFGQDAGQQWWRPLEQEKQKRYDNDISDILSGQAVWGMHTVKDSSRIIFLVEGVFDAVKVHNSGFPAIAVLTKTPNRTLLNQLYVKYHIFSPAQQKDVVLVFIPDKDDTQLKIGKVCHDVLRIPPQYKDIGEMPQNEVDWMLVHCLYDIFIGPELERVTTDDEKKAVAKYWLTYILENRVETSST